MQDEKPEGAAEPRAEPVAGEGQGTGEPPSDEKAGSPAGAGRARAARGGDGQLAEVVGDLLGRLWRRGRGEVERAAKKGRERLTLRQLRTDRDRMYQKLGKEARHLLEGGEVEHPGLRRGVERIRDLELRIQEAEDQMRAVGLDPGVSETASDVDSAENGNPGSVAEDG